MKTDGQISQLVTKEATTPNSATKSTTQEIEKLPMSKAEAAEYMDMAKQSGGPITLRGISIYSKPRLQQGLQPKGLDIKGKSSIISLIAGLVPCDASLSGKVEVDNMGTGGRNGKKMHRRGSIFYSNVNNDTVKSGKQQYSQEVENTQQTIELLSKIGADILGSAFDPNSTDSTDLKSSNEETKEEKKYRQAKEEIIRRAIKEIVEKGIDKNPSENPSEPQQIIDPHQAFKNLADQHKDYETFKRVFSQEIKGEIFRRMSEINNSRFPTSATTNAKHNNQEYKLLYFKNPNSPESPPIFIIDSSQTQENGAGKIISPLFAIQPPANDCISENFLFFDPKYPERKANQEKEENEQVRFFPREQFLHEDYPQGLEGIDNFLSGINAAFLALDSKHQDTGTPVYCDQEVKVMAYQKVSLQLEKKDAGYECKRENQEEAIPVTADIDILVFGTAITSPFSRLPEELFDIEKDGDLEKITKKELSDQLADNIAQKELDEMIKRFDDSIESKNPLGFGSSASLAIVAAIASAQNNISNHGAEGSNPFMEDIGDDSYLVFEPNGDIKELKNKEEILRYVEEYSEKNGVVFSVNPGWNQSEKKASEQSKPSEKNNCQPTLQVLLSNLISLLCPQNDDKKDSVKSDSQNDDEKDSVKSDSQIDWSKIDWKKLGESLGDEAKKAKTAEDETKQTANELFKKNISLYQKLRALYLLDTQGKELNYRQEKQDFAEAHKTVIKLDGTTLPQEQDFDQDSKQVFIVKVKEKYQELWTEKRQNLLLELKTEIEKYQNLAPSGQLPAIASNAVSGNFFDSQLAAKEGQPRSVGRSTDKPKTTNSMLSGNIPGTSPSPGSAERIQNNLSILTQ